MRLKTNHHKGFTLIETIVVVFIFSMIIYGVAILVSNLLTSTDKQSSLLSGADQARRVTAAFTNELRKSENGANGAFPLASAGSQELIFFSNIDPAPDIERVRYFVQNGRLLKGVIKPTGNLYSTASETTHVVQNDLANGSNPVFLYYSGNYDGTANNFLAEPVNINQVRYIRMDLTIYNTGGLQRTNTYTITAGATIRNLKTNLGD